MRLVQEELAHVETDASGADHGDAEVGPGLVDLAVNVRAGTPPSWLRERLAALVAGSEEGRPRVLALLQLDSVFGHDLPDSPDFVRAVSHAYHQLLSQGAKAAVAALPLTDREVSDDRDHA